MCKIFSLVPNYLDKKVISTIPHRYYLGTMHESKGFQILSGIKREEHNIFWPVFSGLIFFACSIAFISIMSKKILEYSKEHKLRRNIQVNLEMKPQQNNRNLPSNSIATKTLQFNNIKHNIPIFSGIQMFGITLIAFSILLFTIVVHEQRNSYNDKMYPYLAELYLMVLIEPLVVRLIIPIWHVLSFKELREFIIIVMKNLL